MLWTDEAIEKLFDTVQVTFHVTFAGLALFQKGDVDVSPEDFPGAAADIKAVIDSYDVPGKRLGGKAVPAGIPPCFSC